MLIDQISTLNSETDQGGCRETIGIIPSQICKLIFRSMTGGIVYSSRFPAKLTFIIEINFKNDHACQFKCPRHYFDLKYVNQ